MAETRAKARALRDAVNIGGVSFEELDGGDSTPGPSDLGSGAPTSVYEQCRDIRSANREHFVAFYLNSRNLVLRREVMSIGRLNASIVHPREVFVPAIAVCAASLVLAHNHPSGDPTPSEEDLALTRRLMEAGRLIGIELLDHVVVCRDAYASFKERKLLHA